MNATYFKAYTASEFTEYYYSKLITTTQQFRIINNWDNTRLVLGLPGPTEEELKNETLRRAWEDVVTEYNEFLSLAALLGVKI
jgi:hypothetical protein